MSEVFTLTVWDCLKYLYAFLYDWFDYTIHWNPRLRELAWEGVQAWARMAFSKVFEEIEASATAVTDAIEDWATGIIGVLEEGADNIVTQLTNIWGQFLPIWNTFGPNIASTALTVEDWIERAFDISWEYVSQHWIDAVADIDYFYNWVIDWGNTASTWVNDNGTKVWDWIRDRSAEVWEWIRDSSVAVTEWIDQRAGTVWDWIRDRSAEVWTWISTKSGEVWDWLTDTGTPMETLYDKVKVWLEDLYDEKRETLADFLDDPGKFIGDYLTEWFEGTEEKPGPDWFAFLIKLYNDPIGTLLAEFEKWHTLVADWIIKWLEENFPSLEEMIAAIVPPDRGLPTAEDWLKGLLDPETDEEKAYMELLELKLQHIMDDIFPDKPLTAEEVASLISPLPGRT